MISAVAFVVAGFMVLIGPVSLRRRRQPAPQDLDEGIWVNRSSKDAAQAA